MTRYFLALIAVLAATNARLGAVELIRNGSFEVPGPQPGMGGGPFFDEWDDASGLGNDKGFAIRDYPFYENGAFEGQSLPPESPPGLEGSDFTGIVRPAGGGLFYGYQWGRANGSGVSGSATQFLNVAEHGASPFEFSAWLAGATFDETDHAVVTLEFFSGPDAMGSSLGSIAFGGNDQTSEYIIGSLNLGGFADPTIGATQDNWTLYRARGTIPSTAASAAVVIGGTGDNGYADLVSLQVVPEPASIVLACSFGALVVGWTARRRGTSRLIHRTPTTRYET